METDKPFDVLIIGSGIGGLSVGIILSLLRFRVAVIEKNPLPGGLMRSYQRDGQDCPVGIHYFGSFGEGESLKRMCDYLGVTEGMTVERMGQEGPIDRYIFDDFSFDFPEGLDAFAASLEQAFPGEKEPIATIMKNLHAMADIQNSFAFLSSSPPLLDMDLFAPLGTYLAKMNCSSRLRGVLNSMTAGWMGMPESECPVLYHDLALVSYLQSSWRLRRPGSALAETFVSRFKGLGGTLFCGDPAAAILASGNKVQGIRLASGKVHAVHRIVAAIHPKTVLPMLPEGAVAPRHARRIMRLVDTEGLFMAHVVVDAATHPPFSHNIYRLRTDGKGALQNGVFYQLRPGWGEKNLLMIITKSLFSEWRQWEDTTTGRRGVDYENEKTRRADGLLKGAEEIFGSLAGAKILDAYTPLTIRDWVGSPHGSPYGIMRSSGQLSAEAALHRQLVGGLYFAGQNALAPGVLGTLLGSFQTVRQMIGHDRFSCEVFGRLFPER
jgi:all-trans-retinol 13,14-reductase